MKRKYIRTAVISVLVLLFSVTAILRLNIEPADQIGAPSSETAEDSTTPPTEASPEATPDSATDITPSPERDETENTETAENPEPTVTTPAPETPPPPEVAATPEEAPSPEETSPPEEPERHVCTLEIRCDTVMDTSKLENQAVAPYVPADGVILATTEFEFTPGESVFDVLLRATRDMGIQMEFRDDALYSGKYIEGINYLYEFDGGPLSGWMYKVNGQFPNYGCAAYTVEDNDTIVWMYTCDLGVDVGDNSVW